MEKLQPKNIKKMQLIELQFEAFQDIFKQTKDNFFSKNKKKIIKKNLFIF